MNWEKLLFSRLVIAIPEILWSEQAVELALKYGYIKEEELETLKYWKGQVDRTRRTAGKLSSRTFTQRLLILAPELLSVNTINLLRRLNAIDEVDGHKLRLFIRGMRAVGIIPGDIPSNAEFSRRLSSLAGVIFSNETIDLLRFVPLTPAFGKLSTEEAKLLRGILLASSQMSAVRRAFKTGDGILDSLFLVFPQIFSEEFVRAGVLTGAISQENSRKLLAAIKLGEFSWKTGVRVWRAKSFEQRALLTGMGIFSDDMIKFLKAMKIIDADTARLLSVAAKITKTIARTRLDSLQNVNRRYRIVPGESPIKTFANASRISETDLLRLLKEAAEATEKDIQRLAGQKGFGAKTRSAQQAILKDSIFKEMRALWEGVGYLTISGESAAAKAGVDAMDFLTGRAWNASGAEADLVRRQLREAGRAGVDALISREENLRPLSARVYGNLNLANGKVTKAIQLGLIRGLSAEELAATVAGLIKPNVKGGISYAAMRLARTEINNAFHLSAIRYTREMPWVQGYTWHLSGSHPKTDICNDYASKSPWSKREVPNKPHPQCFCFVTAVVMPQELFFRQYRKGVFNSYIQARIKAGVYKEDVVDPIAVDAGRRIQLRLPGNR